MFADHVTVAQDDGKVVSLTHRPLFTPRKYSWYSFLLEAGGSWVKNKSVPLQARGAQRVAGS